MTENKNAETLFSIRDLVVEYHSGDSIIHAVNGVSLSLNAGETLGLVGETGAGKTTIARASLRILPDHSVERVEGEILFEGKDVLQMGDTELRELRGKKISMIFQDPMTALNPVKTVISQIAEGHKIHHGCTKAEANQQAVKMLELVGIGADRAEEYPRQFSGGMKQRVVIALALACSPQLLIADEPTTALDVTIQAQDCTASAWNPLDLCSCCRRLAGCLHWLSNEGYNRYPLLLLLRASVSGSILLYPVIALPDR